MADIIAAVYSSMDTTISGVIGYMPKVGGALFLLIIGVILGKIIGEIARVVLDKIKLDKAISATVLADIVKATGMTATGFIGAIVRWFIYLIFIMAAVDVLQMATVSALVEKIILYMPNLISGILILIGGLLIVDLVADMIEKLVVGMKIEGVKQIMVGMRAFLYLTVSILALDQLLIDTKILYTFLVPIAWAVAIILVFRYGLKDSLVAYAKENRHK